VARGRWRDRYPVTRHLLERWRKPKPEDVPVRLPFSDIIEFAIALLSISPRELQALRWTFAQRKWLLDHMLACGRSAEGIEPNKLATKQIELRLPNKVLVRLHHFAVRELPKGASNAAVIDRVLTALDEAWHRHERPSHAASSDKQSSPTLSAPQAMQTCAHPPRWRLYWRKGNCRSTGHAGLWASSKARDPGHQG
jgi:hypothetical protein